LRLPLLQPISTSYITDPTMKASFFAILATLLTGAAPSLSFVVPSPSYQQRQPQQGTTTTTTSSSSSSSLSSTTQERQKTEDSVEEATEKYGLEVGLFKSLQNKDGGESAKSLLKKYGIAYLATSIPLALVSFAICYVLVDNGVDVGNLLSQVGIESGGATETAGTFAIAYAAHKAASPIRFPPTVILTPVVAKLIGKEPDEVDDDDDGDENMAP